LIPVAFIACLSIGCTPGKPEEAISQASALEVMRTHILEEPALFERIEYNPVSERVAEKWIDPSIKRGIEQRNFGRWPRTKSESKRLAFSFKEAAWRSVLDDVDGRFLVEQQMRNYWDSPKVEATSQGDSVEMDLGVTPGAIELTSRGYYSIQKSEFENEAALIPSELVRRLEGLREDYPAAKRWRVTVIVRPSIEHQHPITYEYNHQEDRLFVYSHREVYYSPTPLQGKLARLLTGESPIQTRDMKVLPQNRVGKPLLWNKPKDHNYSRDWASILVLP
jgi:hypothetical protein